MSKKINSKDEELKENILKGIELLYDSDFSIFSRFIVKVKGMTVDKPLGVGCVFSNSKVVLYQPAVDIMATYPSLELFEAEFNPHFGYEVVYLDKALPYQNKNVN